MKYRTSNVTGDRLNIKLEFCLQHKTVLPVLLCVVEYIHGIYSCGLADSADSRCIKNIKSINDG